MYICVRISELATKFGKWPNKSSTCILTAVVALAGHVCH